jgi:hypothetical protein
MHQNRVDPFSSIDTVEQPGASASRLRRNREADDVGANGCFQRDRDGAIGAGH